MAVAHPAPQSHREGPAERTKLQRAIRPADCLTSLRLCSSVASALCNGSSAPLWQGALIRPSRQLSILRLTVQARCGTKGG